MMPPKGWGTTKNCIEGYRLASCSADHLSPWGLFVLGTCYNFGMGTAIDLTRAAQLYESAATLNHSLAQFNLGVCYERGEGLPKCDTEAVNATPLYHDVTSLL